MLGVIIYEWQDGEDRVVGTIRMVDGQLQAVPAENHLLQSILSTPIRGNKYNPVPVSATEDPVKFLNNLRYQYKSPYLRASEPRELPL